jgi:hypothetical protein
LQDGIQVLLAAMLDLGEGSPAHKGHVRLDGLAFAAERGGVVRRLHDLADAVHEEPSGFHAAIERPLYLAGRDAFLRATNELDGLQPQVQREVAILEDRADANREGLTAGVALAKARTAGLAGQAADPLAIAVSAMRANRAIWPQMGLDVLKRRFLIVKMTLG